MTHTTNNNGLDNLAECVDDLSHDALEKFLIIFSEKLSNNSDNDQNKRMQLANLLDKVSTLRYGLQLWVSQLDSLTRFIENELRNESIFTPLSCVFWRNAVRLLRSVAVQVAPSWTKTIDSDYFNFFLQKCDSACSEFVDGVDLFLSHSVLVEHHFTALNHIVDARYALWYWLKAIRAAEDMKTWVVAMPTPDRHISAYYEKNSKWVKKAGEATLFTKDEAEEVRRSLGGCNNYWLLCLDNLLVPQNKPTEPVKFDWSLAEARAPLNATCEKCGRIYCDHEYKY